MLDGVAVRLALNGLEQEETNVFLDKLVTEVLVEAEVGEIPAALSIMPKVLRVLEHVDHELDAAVSDFRVAVEHLSDMGQASRRVQLRLRVLRLSAQLHDGLNDVRLNRQVLAAFLLLG